MEDSGGRDAVIQGMYESNGWRQVRFARKEMKTGMHPKELLDGIIRQVS